jgi:phosphatidylinositol alpha-1,6-mannosyltransferase
LKALMLCFRQRPDVIFSGHMYHGPLAARLTNLFNARLISQLHGTEIWSPLEKRHLLPLRQSEIVLCVSQDTKDRYLAQVGVHSDNAAILHNTVNPRFTIGDRLAARQAFALTDEFAILTVARLDGRSGYKGHDRILKALPGLAAAGRKLVYLIAGAGEDQDRLEKLAQQCGVQQQTRFLGKVPSEKLPALYCAADLFALPSSGEGFGIVFVEAMACGAPAIGLALGGAPDALSDIYGKAVDPENFAAELQAIIEQAEAMSQAERISLSCRTTAKFGQQRFRQRLKKITTQSTVRAPHPITCLPT